MQRLLSIVGLGVLLGCSHSGSEDAKPGAKGGGAGVAGRIATGGANDRSGQGGVAAAGAVDGQSVVGTAGGGAGSISAAGETSHGGAGTSPSGPGGQGAGGGSGMSMGGTTSGGATGVSAGGAAGAVAGGTAAGGDGGVRTAPGVVTRSPESSATGVSTRSAIRVMFSKALDPSTVTSNAFFLAQGSARVTGGVALDGTTAVFTPSWPLSLGESYTATLTAALADLDGNPLAGAPVTWSFATRDGTWGVAKPIDTAGGRYPHVAGNANGNAVAVWHQSDGSRTSVWATVFALPTGWGPPTLIEHDDAGDVGAPQVALDSNGNAMAVWSQSDGTRSHIWANRCAVGAGWAASATQLEASSTGSAGNPVVTMDSSGNAMVVWDQSDGTRGSIWARRFVSATGWADAARLEGGDPAGNDYPQMAMNSNGEATAVWKQYDGTRNSVWTNRFAPALGWGSAKPLESSDENAETPQVAMDSNGNAIAIWEQSDGARSNIWFNRLVSGADWSGPTLLENNDTGSAHSPSVAMDSNGNAIAVWEQYSGTRNDVWFNRFLLGTGWGGPQLLEDNDASSATLPRIAMTHSGSAMVVWKQSSGGTAASVWAKRFTPAAGFGGPVLIETNDNYAFMPQVACDALGNAFAVWEQSDGAGARLWANVFSEPVP